jgi:hypothetical protein
VTGIRRAGTPALRKYFLREDVGGDLTHSADTSIPSAWKTTEPSGLRISLVAVRNRTAA